MGDDEWLEDFMMNVVYLEDSSGRWRLEKRKLEGRTIRRPLQKFWLEVVRT